MRSVRLQKSDGKVLILKETRQFQNGGISKQKEKLLRQEKTKRHLEIEDIYSNQIERIDSDSPSVNNDSQTIRFA